MVKRRIGVTVCMSNKIEIHSVMRLSDRKIFTVGDNVKLHTMGKIKSFIVYYQEGIIKFRAVMVNAGKKKEVRIEDL